MTRNELNTLKQITSEKYAAYLANQNHTTWLAWIGAKHRSESARRAYLHERAEEYAVGFGE